PTANQNVRAPILPFFQTDPAVFLRHLDSERADFRQPFEIFRWKFTGAIDLVGINVIAQIAFQLLQKIFASGAIFSALRGIRVNSIEIIASDEKIARETSAV